jgi:hypothetical protein
MKHARRKDESTILDGETPVNPCTRIRIWKPCIVSLQSLLSSIAVLHRF